jgi:oxidase EvaA
MHNPRISNQKKHIYDFRNWQKKTLKDNQFQCKPIPFSESNEWYFNDGKLKHRTNGFFSLAGIAAEARHSKLNGQEQLIILQHQIALNSFLMRKGPVGTEILFQGRVEPGNIGGMQLAPTVQSTKTNYKRLHGGKPTPMIGWFLKKNLSGIVYDELQSEEATRYYGKYNRNLVVQIDFDTEVEDNETFRWFDMDHIRSFVITDNVLNTDARSVISCMNWELLVEDNLPFDEHPVGSFGKALQGSYNANTDSTICTAFDLMRWLTKLRVQCGLRTHIKHLNEIRNWVVENACIRELKNQMGFEARQYLIKATGREVATWDQPLINSHGIGRLTLVCQEKNRILHFLVKASHEIGFLEGIQISSSISIPPGGNIESEKNVERFLLEIIDSKENVKIIQKCRQSEEGGRFYNDENDYEIVLLDPAIVVPENDLYRWTTLSQLRELIKISSILSIEMRGVMALLLAYI